MLRPEPSLASVGNELSRLASGNVANQAPIVESAKVVRPRRDSVVRISTEDTVIVPPATTSISSGPVRQSSSSALSNRSTSSKGYPVYSGDDSFEQRGATVPNAFTFGRKLWHQFKASTLETLDQDPDMAENLTVNEHDMKSFKQFCTTVVADDYFSALLDYLHSSSIQARTDAHNMQSPMPRVHRAPSRRASAISTSALSSTAASRRASAISTSAFSSTATRLSDSSVSEFDPLAQKFVLPPQIEDCGEGVALSHAYGVVVMQKSNHKFLSRERAFFEIFLRFSTILAFKTVPAQFRHQLAQEIARIGRSNSFNSQRRIQESFQDAEMERRNSRQVYDMKEIGRSSRDTRVINALNAKRKAIHPHVSVTRMTTLLSRSPMVSVKFPAAHEQLETKLRRMEESKSLSLHLQSTSEWSMSQQSPPKRPPFDPCFNSGKGVGAVRQADLLAATARAGGAMPDWGESFSHQQVLSADKQQFHRLAGPFTTELLAAPTKPAASDSQLEDRFMPLKTKAKRPQALQIDAFDGGRRESGSDADNFNFLSTSSVGSDGSSPLLSPVNRRVHLLSQGSFGYLNSPLPRPMASAAAPKGGSRPALSAPQFEPGNVIETGRPPHYLVNRERSLLRQSLDDHALAEDVRRLEERLYNTRAYLVSLHGKRAQRNRKKKHLLLAADDHTAPAPQPRAKKARSPKQRSPKPRSSDAPAAPAAVKPG